MNAPSSSGSFQTPTIEGRIILTAENQTAAGLEDARRDFDSFGRQSQQLGNQQQQLARSQSREMEASAARWATWGKRAGAGAAAGVAAINTMAFASAAFWRKSDMEAAKLTDTLKTYHAAMDTEAVLEYSEAIAKAFHAPDVSAIRSAMSIIAKMAPANSAEFKKLTERTMDLSVAWETTIPEAAQRLFQASRSSRAAIQLLRQEFGPNYWAASGKSLRATQQLYDLWARTGQYGKIQADILRQLEGRHEGLYKEVNKTNEAYNLFLLNLNKFWETVGKHFKPGTDAMFNTMNKLMEAYMALPEKSQAMATALMAVGTSMAAGFAIGGPWGAVAAGIAGIGFELVNLSVKYVPEFGRKMAAETDKFIVTAKRFGAAWELMFGDVDVLDFTIEQVELFFINLNYYAGQLATGMEKAADAAHLFKDWVTYLWPSTTTEERQRIDKYWSAIMDANSKAADAAMAKAASIGRGRMAKYLGASMAGASEADIAAYKAHLEEVAEAGAKTSLTMQLTGIQSTSRARRERMKEITKTQEGARGLEPLPEAEPVITPGSTAKPLGGENPFYGPHPNVNAPAPHMVTPEELKKMSDAAAEAPEQIDAMTGAAQNAARQINQAFGAVAGSGGDVTEATQAEVNTKWRKLTGQAPLAPVAAPAPLVPVYQQTFPNPMLSGQPPARQHGGAVTGGKPYLVGETGREMFVPKADGSIAPMRAPATPPAARQTPAQVDKMNAAFQSATFSMAIFSGVVRDATDALRKLMGAIGGEGGGGGGGGGASTAPSTGGTGGTPTGGSGAGGGTAGGGGTPTAPSAAVGGMAPVGSSGAPTTAQQVGGASFGMGGGAGAGGGGGFGTYGAPGSEWKTQAAQQQAKAAAGAAPAAAGTAAAIKGGPVAAGQQAQALDMAKSIEGSWETDSAGRAKITKYLKTGGIGMDPKDTAWCAAMVNSSLAQVGIKGSGSQYATSFGAWGEPVDPKTVQKGDVLYKMGTAQKIGQGGGHVGFATGNKEMRNGVLWYEMYGGNQTAKGSGDRGVAANTKWVSSAEYRDPRRAPVDPNAKANMDAAANGPAQPATAPVDNTARKDVSPQDYFGKDTDLSKLPAGMRNNNPGNIKYGVAYPGITGPSKNLDEGEPQSVFNSPQSGMDAMAALAMKKYNRGLHTVRQIMYTGEKPWTKGNPKAPVNIAKTMGIDPDDPVDFTDPAQLKSFMKALVAQEHGDAGAKYGDDLYTNAANRALGKEAPPQATPAAQAAKAAASAGPPAANISPANMIKALQARAAHQQAAATYSTPAKKPIVVPPGQQQLPQGESAFGDIAQRQFLEDPLRLRADAQRIYGGKYTGQAWRDAKGQVHLGPPPGAKQAPATGKPADRTVTATTKLRSSIEARALAKGPRIEAPTPFEMQMEAHDRIAAAYKASIEGGDKAKAMADRVAYLRMGHKGGAPALDPETGEPLKPSTKYDDARIGEEQRHQAAVKNRYGAPLGPGQDPSGMGYLTGVEPPKTTAASLPPATGTGTGNPYTVARPSPTAAIPADLVPPQTTTAPTGARASGGPVSGGTKYKVGEKGPEVFLPANKSQQKAYKNAQKALMGLREDDPIQAAKITKYLEKGGMGLSPADKAWCAATVGSALAQQGIKGTGSLAASSYAAWGQKVEGKPDPGDVMVTMGKAGKVGETGGHVGFATGEQQITKEGVLQYQMFGGNQAIPGKKDAEGKQFYGKASKQWVDASKYQARRAPVGKQTGGTTSTRTPYMVGEGGPELFVPNTAGTIVPMRAPIPGVDKWVMPPGMRGRMFQEQPTGGMAGNINPADVAAADLDAAMHFSSKQPDSPLASWLKGKGFLQPEPASPDAPGDSRIGKQPRSPGARSPIGIPGVSPRDFLNNPLLPGTIKVGIAAATTTPPRDYIAGARRTDQAVSAYLGRKLGPFATQGMRTSNLLEMAEAAPSQDMMKQRMATAFEVAANQPQQLPMPGMSGATQYAARQHGGPVSSGTPYKVGENAPEMFMPQQRLNITPFQHLPPPRPRIRDPIESLAPNAPVKLGRGEVSVRLRLDKGLIPDKPAISNAHQFDLGVNVDRTGSFFSRPGDPAFPAPRG